VRKRKQHARFSNREKTVCVLVGFRCFGPGTDICSCRVAWLRRRVSFRLARLLRPHKVRFRRHLSRKSVCSRFRPNTQSTVGRVVGWFSTHCLAQVSWVRASVVRFVSAPSSVRTRSFFGRQVSFVTEVTHTHNPRAAPSCVRDRTSVTTPKTPQQGTAHLTQATTQEQGISPRQKQRKPTSTHTNLRAPNLRVK
jgi:hypothetical protein